MKDKINMLNYPIENYLIGYSNKLAWGFAQEIISNYKKKAQTLFIEASPGYGKTHLAKVIQYKINEYYPKDKTHYQLAQYFGYQFIDICCNKGNNKGKTIQQKVKAFNNKYLGLSLLIFEDIDFFIGKTRTTKEFMYICKMLEENNSTVVVTSKTPLCEFSPEIQSHFAKNFVVKIDTDIHDLSIKIIQKFENDNDIKLSKELTKTLLEEFSSTVSGITGILKLILMHQDRYNEEIPVEILKEISSFGK